MIFKVRSVTPVIVEGVENNNSYFFVETEQRKVVNHFVNTEKKSLNYTLNSGIKGDQGERGEPGSNIIELECGETVSGGKVVVINDDGKIYVFDRSNDAHYGKTCGISKQAGLEGDIIEVYYSGIAYEAGSGWAPGNVYYVSANGTLTTAIPTSGITKIIGIGIDTDKVLINQVYEVVTI